MERQEIIQELRGQIENLTRLQQRHGIRHPESVQRQKDAVQRLVREHGIDVRSELEPITRLLYRRYFD